MPAGLNTEEATMNRTTTTAKSSVQSSAAAAVPSAGTVHCPRDMREQQLLCIYRDATAAEKAKIESAVMAVWTGSAQQFPWQS